jgi:hypothetical protein
MPSWPMSGEGGMTWRRLRSRELGRRERRTQRKTKIVGEERFTKRSTESGEFKATQDNDLTTGHSDPDER